MANKTRYRSQMKGSVLKETVTHTIDTGHKTKLASSIFPDGLKAEMVEQHTVQLHRS